MAKTTKAEAAFSVPNQKEQDLLRDRFRPLLLQNPNYFGNLPQSKFEPQLKLVGNPSYETIGCVGYHPKLEQLHAVVYINRKSGYGGGICSDGSTEYVRFYLSFDDGATWEDQGVSSFRAYDVPENRSRLEYAVTRRVDPQRRFCFFPNLIQARAILSWNAVPPPDQPDFKPVWGGVHDTHIEVDPLEIIIVDELLQAAKVEIPDDLAKNIDLHLPVPASKKKLTVAEKVELYRRTDVEPHRLAFAEIQSLSLNPVLSANIQSPDFTELFPGLDLDLSKIGDLLNQTDGSTFYEELECIGFDQRTDSLVGVIRVKKPNGYSGGPCTAGSTQYVTFWGDLNSNGTFETCLGTASVDVNDYEKIPERGLEYSVALRVDLDRLQRPCEHGATLIPIRAVLSWAVPAPCGNPNFVPVWGNREETVIHIAAGPTVQTSLPVVSSVGDIAVPDITGGYATGFGVETNFSAENSPFGGRVDIAGKIVAGTSTSKYRVMVKPTGAPDTAYVPITNEPSGLKLSLITVTGGGIVHIDPDHIVHADGDGYYPYEDYSSNHFVDGNILMRWYTGPDEHGQTFDLRVHLKVDGDPANDIHSDVVSVRVDNEAPVATLDIDLDGGVECADFEPGEIFEGHYSATDEHFRRFWFEVLPPGPAAGALPAPASGRSVFLAGGTIPDPGVAGAVYSFDTDGMQACGYSLSLWAESRTNVNSGTARHRDRASVGFCIKEQ